MWRILDQIRSNCVQNKDIKDVSYTTTFLNGPYYNVTYQHQNFKDQFEFYN